MNSTTTESAGNIAALAQNFAQDKEFFIHANDQQDISAIEGGLSLYTHKIYERNKKIVLQKKDWAYRIYGVLLCEICGFDYEKFYGSIGKGFIECHHLIPLHNLGRHTFTRLDDLILVCSNCHRMIHRNGNILSAEDMKRMVR